MAFETLSRIEEQLDALQKQGNATGDTALRSRIVVFSNRVYEEIEKGFDGVYAILSEIVNARQSQLNEQFVADLLKQVDYSHSREKFKFVLEVCDRLDELARTYRSDIDRVLNNAQGQYSDLFWLLEKHEGIFRRTIERAVDDIGEELRKYRSGGNIDRAQKLAELARRELRVHLDRVRRTRIALTGKSGDMRDLIDDEKRADKTLRQSAWFNGTFYLAAVATIISLLTFVAGQLDFGRFAVVVVGAYVGLTLVGAFQLKNDEKLSERGFLALVRMAFVRVLMPAMKSTKSTG